MALLEKVTQEDLVLYEILRNPVLFYEFINYVDKEDWEEEFNLDWYQKQFMLDFNEFVSISCARSVGKTASISGLILWMLIFNVFPDDYIVYTVPNRVHLEPVWVNYLVKLLRGNSFLVHFVDTSKGINGSTYTITTKIGSSLLCRIAGTSGTGANVVGLHTPVLMVDESAFYPYRTFLEAQPTVKTFIRGHKIIVSGVPNGLREKNVNWHCQNENKAYSKHHVSAFDNPRFTEQDKRNAIEIYGDEDSDDYIHNVLGLPGKPIFALFDRELMEISDYPVYKLSIDSTQQGDNIGAFIDKLSIFPTVVEKHNGIFMGVDLGYTDPTAIFVMYIDTLGRLKFHGKIKLTKVNYYIQERIIDYLDTKFNPMFIAIDRGGPGDPVITRLKESAEFAHKNYRDRLIPIDFSSSIVLGVTADGQEIKMKTKPLSVTVLQDYSNQHKIVYSSTDLETIAELERMTYTKTITGDMVFKTLTERGGKRGEDHFTSALLCAVLGVYMTTDIQKFEHKKKKLANSQLSIWR